MINNTIMTNGLDVAKPRLAWVGRLLFGKLETLEQENLVDIIRVRYIRLHCTLLKMYV